MRFVAQLALKTRTVLLLGPVNVARVALYRLGLLTGLAPVQRLHTNLPTGPFFRSAAVVRTAPPPAAWRNCVSYFGWFTMQCAERAFPDWHADPISGGRVAASDRPWWEIPDFSPDVGDIKAIWEASRFDWVLTMAQRAATRETSEVDRLNAWLDDWCERNPPYLGPNWKCGQEASIRVLHLAMAALVSGQAASPCPGVLDLVEAHLKRIAPTLRYAMAQDNNHGTSEAAALLVGGIWLANSGRASARAWERLGRRWMENRVRRLIAPDGSFSQYSVNYHRLMLDTLSMVEVWRRHAGLTRFSARWYERAAAAARWLAAMVDPETGDAFNLGANDGARLLPLVDADYRDFRPSVQLAMALFASTRAYSAAGMWNEPLRWLDVPVPEAQETPVVSRLFDDGGYALLRRGSASILLRYPRFRFRPSHADALHVDLWLSGKNLLRDAGTFSYSDSSNWRDYFRGTTGHNTVQFDGRDQMPTLSRFLFGDWLRTRELQPPAISTLGASCGASYRDRQGAIHERTVSLEDGRLVVDDAISGFARKAVLRWRLSPGPWQIDGHVATDGCHRLSVKASARIVRFDLIQGWESRYYLQKTAVPVLEVEVDEPGTLTTEYHWL